jgi:hypothetical protein
MVEGDIFREVEEDIRRERLARAWNDYGVYVLLAAFAIVAGVAGYQAWQWWTLKKASENGEAFVKAIQLGEDGKTDDMTAALTRIAEDGGRGYAALARLRSAHAAAEAGKTDVAAATYLAVADDGLADPFLRDFARVQWATLSVDAAPQGEIVKRMQPLASVTGPWRHSARELMGLAAYKAANMRDAEQHFQDIAADAEAPTEIRRRAQTMLAVLPKSKTPEAPQTKEPTGNETKTQ